MDTESQKSEGGIPWMHIHGENETVPDNFAKELAGIVVEWSRFENGIAMDTAQFMRIPNIRALTKDAPINFKKKIELWKACILTLYPEVKIYTSTAVEICSKGKIVAQHRHRLMHGHWFKAGDQQAEYDIVSVRGLEKVEYFDAFTVDMAYMQGLHSDIRLITDRLFEFQANRMWHASLGMLKAQHAP
jgi:hypothetical protein